MKLLKMVEEKAPENCEYGECLHNKNGKCSKEVIVYGYVRFEDGKTKKICTNFEAILTIS